MSQEIAVKQELKNQKRELSEHRFFLLSQPGKYSSSILKVVGKLFSTKIESEKNLDLKTLGTKKEENGVMDRR